MKNYEKNIVVIVLYLLCGYKISAQKNSNQVEFKILLNESNVKIYEPLTFDIFVINNSPKDFQFDNINNIFCELEYLQKKGKWKALNIGYSSKDFNGNMDKLPLKQSVKVLKSGDSFHLPKNIFIYNTLSSKDKLLRLKIRFATFSKDKLIQTIISNPFHIKVEHSIKDNAAFKWLQHNGIDSYISDFFILHFNCSKTSDYNISTAIDYDKIKVFNDKFLETEVAQLINLHIFLLNFKKLEEDEIPNNRTLFLKENVLFYYHKLNTTTKQKYKSIIGDNIMKRIYGYE